MNSSVNFSGYNLLNVSWLTELTFNEKKTLKTVAESFLKHSPEMIAEIQEAVNSNSPDQLIQAIKRSGAVAAMFTNNDFSNKFYVITSDNGRSLSLYSVQKANSIILELEALQSEVSYYLYNKSN